MGEETLQLSSALSIHDLVLVGVNSNGCPFFIYSVEPRRSYAISAIFVLLQRPDVVYDAAPDRHPHQGEPVRVKAAIAPLWSQSQSNTVPNRR